MASGTNNSILGNALYAGTAAAIDLNRNGPTVNDAGDGDGGANGTQNFPVIQSARSSGGIAIFAATLDSRSNTTFRVEFFSSPLNQSTNLASALLFLGATNVTTAADGKVAFTFAASSFAPAGHMVTATATDPDGNTSELSPCVLLGGAPYVARPVGSLGHDLGQGNDMNNRGDVTGFANGGDGLYTHAFLCTNGVMTDLGTLGGNESNGLGINDAGDVVGWAEISPGVTRAFLYRNGQRAY